MDQKGYGDENNLPALISSPEVEWACVYLDKWSLSSKFTPSKLLMGALKCLERPYREVNPDWLAQSAHSIREIFYNMPNIGTRKGSMKAKIALTQAEQNAEEIADKLCRLYNSFTTIAHHFADDKDCRKLLVDLDAHFGIKLSDTSEVKDVYQQLIANFVFLLKRTAENILEVHKKIDDFVLKKVATLTDEDKVALEFLLHSHIHAKNYFYSIAAPVGWCEWLAQAGFFAALHQKAEDPTRYSFRLPELKYLSRVVQEGGDEDVVVNMMESVDCSQQFNPEVVDQFLWIVEKMSVDSVRKLLPKLAREDWPSLMQAFKPSAYSYEQITKKLVDAKDGESILILAQTLLSPVEQKPIGYGDQYFCLNDLGHTGIFSALASMEGTDAERALKLVIDRLCHFVSRKEEGEVKVFEFDTDFPTYDVDLFTLKVREGSRGVDRDDIKNLVAVFVALTKTLFSRCDENSNRIYPESIQPLPDAQFFWKVKIFAMSLCPENFSSQLKDAMNRLFEGSFYQEFLFGTEYFKTLSKAIPLWSPEDQTTYIKNVFRYFEDRIRENPEYDWTKSYAWRVLSSIPEGILTEADRDACEKHFDQRPDSHFNPTPYISSGRGGMVVNQSPVDFSGPDYVAIPTIVESLKDELAPDVLKEKYKNDDFLRPRDAEGVGDDLRKNMKTRISEYLQHAIAFLDPAIHEHYTHSFLRAIEEWLRESNKLTQQDWTNLLPLLVAISAVQKLERVEDVGDRERNWLATWTWVEKDVANILKFFTTNEYKDVLLANRSTVLELLSTLLNSADPTLEHEKRDDGDLYSVAINTTRGVAFEAFVNFVCQDGEGLQEDVIGLYKRVIASATPSVRFVIGRYLAIFYFRAKDEVRGLLRSIFPLNPANVEEFCAAWDGYVTNILYRELFEELKVEYEYAFTFERFEEGEGESKKRRRDPEEGITNHLALAFAHFDEVQFDEKLKHPLLHRLFEDGNTRLQKVFVSFLGRAILTRDQSSADWFKENNVKPEKLKAFWELLIGMDLPPEVYGEFGFWINRREEIFEYTWLAEQMAKTLKKSKGHLSWEFGLMEVMPEFISLNPDACLDILEIYLLEGVLGGASRQWFHVDAEKVTLFEDLYAVRPDRTKELINKLLYRGGSLFWPIKDIPK